MIDERLESVVEELIVYLNNSDSVKDYNNSKREFETNPELLRLSKEFARLSQEFHVKQVQKTLTQDDIDSIRNLRQKINALSVTQRHAQAQQKLISELLECNNLISSILGFDFAAAVSAKSGCC
jgi:cell fate (sporulation/competence/biofilm development) regulator YlbF (YheA/YmcA/DUF963 family)